MFDRVVELYLAYVKVGNAVLVVGITSIVLVVWNALPRPPPKPRPVERDLSDDQITQWIRPLNPNPIPSSLRRRTPTGLSREVDAVSRSPHGGSSTALEEGGSIFTHT